MGHKDTFEKALLNTDTNIVGRHTWRRLCNQYEDPRLDLIASIVDSALDKIQRKPLISSDRQGDPVFRTRKDSTPLGMVVSIEHFSGEIQFACPRDDKTKLLVSVYRRHDGIPSLQNHSAAIYDYTGNIEAANELLIKWLAEAAPGHKAEISAILGRLDENNVILKRFDMAAERFGVSVPKPGG